MITKLEMFPNGCLQSEYSHCIDSAQKGKGLILSIGSVQYLDRSDAQPLSLGMGNLSSLLEALCLDNQHRNGQSFGCGSACCLIGGWRVEQIPAEVGATSSAGGVGGGRCCSGRNHVSAGPGPVPSASLRDMAAHPFPFKNTA